MADGELSGEELEAQTGEPLPERAVMSTIDPSMQGPDTLLPDHGPPGWYTIQPVEPVPADDAAIEATAPETT